MQTTVLIVMSMATRFVLRVGVPAMSQVYTVQTTLMWFFVNLTLREDWER